MSENTKIEWADHSWSPWRGCTKVSPGCANCYAETLSKRNPAVLGQWGRGKPRVFAMNWDDPVKWNAKPFVCETCGAGIARPGDPHQRPKEKGKPRVECDGMKSHRATVFPSLCDWLDEEVPAEWLAKFIGVIRDTPNLRWLLLTKRPENFRDRLLTAMAGNWADPADLTDRVHAWIEGTRIPRNVWVGTSVEDQPRTARLDHLRRIPAVGRFVSFEPLLSHIECGNATHRPESVPGAEALDGIDWAIIGGESGPGARACNVEWIRSLVRQCEAAGVAPFVKQLGAHPVGRWTESPEKSGLGQGWPAGLKIAHPKGGDPAEWPDDVRVRKFPEGLR